MDIAAGFLRLSESFCYSAIQHAKSAWVTSAITTADVALSYKRDLSPHLASHMGTVQVISSVGLFIAEVLDLIRVIPPGNPPLARPVLLTMAAMTACSVGYTALRAMAGCWPFPKELLAEAEIPETARSSLRITSIPLVVWVMAEALRVMRIVTNGGLIYFSSENRLFHLWNIAGELYALFKSLQVKWFTFTRTGHFWDAGYGSISYRYTVPLIASPPDQEEGCIVCPDPPQVTLYVPHQHAYYDYKCLARLIFQKSEEWLQTNITLYRLDASSPQKITEVSAQMPQSRLPRCSLCNLSPPNSDFKAQAYDAAGKEISTVFSIKKDSSVPALAPLISDATVIRCAKTILVISSTLQALLPTMQLRHPELAQKILPLSTIFNCLDLLSLIVECIALYEEFMKVFMARFVAKTDTTTDPAITEARERLAQLKEEKEPLLQEVVKGIKQGDILPIRKKHISLSEEGVRILQQTAENVLKLDSEEVMRALLNGDIITIDDPIPLTREAVLLLRRWKLAIQEGKEIALVEKQVAPPSDQLKKTLEACLENGQTALDAIRTRNNQDVLAWEDTDSVDRAAGSFSQAMWQIYTDRNGIKTAKGFISHSAESQQLAQDLNACIDNCHLVFRKKEKKEVKRADGNLILLKTGRTIGLTPEADERIKKFMEVAGAKREAKRKLQLAEGAAKNKAEAEQKLAKETYKAKLERGVRISAIAIPALSAITPLFLKKYWRPAIDWTSLLQKIGAPHTNAGWHLPNGLYLMQSLMVAKLTVGFALTLFAPTGRSLFAFTTFLRGITLWKMSQQPWIWLQRSALVEDDSTSSPIGILQTTFQVLLPSTPSSPQFTEHLKNVCDYTSKWFHESSWTRQWWYETANEVLTKRGLTSAVSNLPLESPDGKSLFWSYAVSFLPRG